MTPIEVPFSGPELLDWADQERQTMDYVERQIDHLITLCETKPLRCFFLRRNLRRMKKNLTFPKWRAMYQSLQDQVRENPNVRRFLVPKEVLDGSAGWKTLEAMQRRYLHDPKPTLDPDRGAVQ